MNLYDQLVQLQEIPGAHQAWSTYREQLTSYIISQLDEKDEVAILGVGRSHDIDLKRIVKQVASLVLIDKDEAAVQSAMKQYDIEQEDKVTVCVQDLIGLTEDDYRIYADELIKEVRKKGRATDVNELAQYALRMIEKLSLKMQPIDLGENVYDTMIVVGLHSQLLSMLEWIWQVILQTLGQEEHTVRMQIIKLNQQVIEAFHQKLMKATRARCIIGCELSRKGRVGSIQGAIQGIENLEVLRRQKKLNKQSEYRLDWPFHEANGMIYEMLIQCDSLIK